MKYLLLSLILLSNSVNIFAQMNVSALINSSRRFEFHKKYEQAIEKIDEAINLEPKNEDLYVRKAGLHNSLNDGKAVYQTIEKLININPENERTLQKAASLLTKYGFYEESLKIANRLISGNPEKLYLYRLRFPNRFYLGNYHGTMEDIFKGRAFRQTKSPHQNILFRTLDKLKDDPKVFYYYDELIKEANKPLKISTMGSFYSHEYFRKMMIGKAAKFYFEKELFEKAENLMAEIISYKTDEDAYIFRSNIYQDIGKYDKAISNLTTAIELANETLEHYKIENEKYRANGQTYNAINNLRHIDSVKERMAKYHFKRGELYSTMHNFDLAISEYKIVIELNSGLKSKAENRIKLAEKGIPMILLPDSILFTQ